MNRVDWIVLRRVSARVILTLLVFFGLMALVESLDTWRFTTLSKTGGPLLGILAIVSGAARAMVNTLPVTVLIGTIIGVLDLQARRELTVIKATGTSIWRAMRAPVIAALLLGLFAAFIADSLAIQVNRSLPISAARASTAALWLEQEGKDGPYLLYASRSRANGTVLDNVDVFFTDGDRRDRIEAKQAKLAAGKWKLSGAVRFRPNTKPEPLDNFTLATRTTAGDMQVRLTSVRDLTFGELMAAVSKSVADPELRAAAATSLLRLFATPALLAGSVIMSFAFTAGYRRTNKYGGAVLYGIVLGFVVYVVTELANRSGFAGVLDPAFAAAGPAFVAIVIGVTVLLFKEDGASVMFLRRGKSFEFSPRPLLGNVLACVLVAGLSVLPAEAALLPPGFFDMQVSPGAGAAGVEADRLTYDARTDTISAEGSAVLSYQGYTVRADRIDFYQKTGMLKAVGNAVLRDPMGNIYHVDSVDVTGGMKEAFLNSMTLETPDGAQITARDARYSATLQTILTEATYSPCGLCIDSKGRRIGWQVKAARMIYDREKASLTMEQPSLELLGIPVAWLPSFWMPDPSQPRAQGFRSVQLDYNAKLGVTAAVPYFIPVGEDIDVVLSPQLLSRQGALLGAKINWRMPGYGAIEVKASGLYQLDPSAFSAVGNRDWRGAIQTSGTFTPVENWTVGWSYSMFSDNAYLRDYGFSDKRSSINQVFGTYLNEMTYLDMRVQRFNRLGNYRAADDDKQGMNLPVIHAEHVQDLQPGWGRVHLTGDVLSVYRADDQTRTYHGVPYNHLVPYVFGYQGAKQHLALEGAWENQVILPGGVTATPYLGMRLDAANYDGASGITGAPPASMLLSATPIAAIDFRWPLIARNGFDTHLLEPVAQLVYRGSDTTAVGITNDDAQSFIFDTANLFSYNRFSGIDRQETGLRANVGAHYVGNFADGSWIDMLMGQSFHLAGVNALGIADAAQAGNDTGLGDTASYFVASARGGWANGLSAGSKIQVDPAGPRITRAGIGGQYTAPDGFTTGADYMFIAKSVARGTIEDEHQIGARVGIPVADYWTVDGGITYNVDAWNWVKANTAIIYDDNYLMFGAGADFTPTSWGVGVKFKLKGPGGHDAF